MSSEIIKTTGHFQSFDGTPIYYEVRGQGPPIVMTYGIACLMNHWRHQFRYFSRHYQTILFDYRGHHRTPLPKDRRNLSLNAIAKDLKHLMDHLELEKASFWSHSFGSQVLINSYSLYPEIFENLVLINGFATNPIHKMFGNDLALNGFKLLKAGYKRVPSTINTLWKGLVNNPLSMALTGWAGGFNTHLTSFKDIEIYSRGVATMDVDAFLTLFDQMMKYDGRPVLEKITVPTLIIGGTSDNVTPKDFQEELHQRIPGSQLMMVPYGSHCTQLDMPDFVNLRIEKFLRSVVEPSG